MGYRIGFQCFATKEAATDYQMSMVAPTILSDGRMVYPEKSGETWHYMGQPVNLDFGVCEPMEDFKDGVYIAGLYVGLFALAFLFKFTSKFIWQAFKQEDTIIVEKD